MIYQSGRQKIFRSRNSWIGFIIWTQITLPFGIGLKHDEKKNPVETLFYPYY